MRGGAGSGSGADYPHRSCGNRTSIVSPRRSGQTSSFAPDARIGTDPRDQGTGPPQGLPLPRYPGRCGPALHGRFDYRFWPSRGQYSWLKFAPYNPADFGISADKTEHVLWRIENGELDGIHPKVMVLMIGTNNDGVDKPEWIASAIEKIVAVTHDKLPATKVLLLGIFPRGKHGNRATVVNQQVNDILSKLENGKTVRYLDIGKVFLDVNGDVPPEIMSDGLHPSPHGYDLWYAAMKPLLDQMMK